MPYWFLLLIYWGTDFFFENFCHPIAAQPDRTRAHTLEAGAREGREGQEVLGAREGQQSETSRHRPEF